MEMAYRENDSQRRNDQVRFKMIDHIGVLSMKDTGWTREVNLVSWNGAPAKVDIREWNPEHSRMSRGITLFEEEAETLTRVLADRYGLRLMAREPEKRTFFTEDTAPAPPAPVSEVVAACVAETAVHMGNPEAAEGAGRTAEAGA